MLLSLESPLNFTASDDHLKEHRVCIVRLRDGCCKRYFWCQIWDSYRKILIFWLLRLSNSISFRKSPSTRKDETLPFCSTKI